MEGYLAAAAPETIRFLGRSPAPDAFLALLEGPTAAQLDQMCPAVIERADEHSELETCMLRSTRDALSAIQRAAAVDQGLIFVVL